MNTTMMVMMPGNNADTSILSMGQVLPDPNAALEKSGGDSPNFQKEEDKKASIMLDPLELLPNVDPSMDNIDPALSGRQPHVIGRSQDGQMTFRQGPNLVLKGLQTKQEQNPDIENQP